MEVLKKLQRANLLQVMNMYYLMLRFVYIVCRQTDVNKFTIFCKHVYIQQDWRLPLKFLKKIRDYYTILKKSYFVFVLEEC